MANITGVPIFKILDQQVEGQVPTDDHKIGRYWVVLIYVY